MGSIRITETTQVGDNYSTVEYEFSEAEDYFLWDDMRNERLSNALKSFSDSFLDTQDEVGENVTEIKVGKKKEKLH
jgi:hypothetical protein